MNKPKLNGYTVIVSKRTKPLNRRTLLIKAVVSLAFMAMLFVVAGRKDFLSMLQQVDPLYFILSFVIAAAQISTSCMKWQVLVNLYGDRLRFGYLMRLYLIGYYFTNLLPSNVGGDVIRSYYAGRRIGNQTHSAISVFMERFTGSIYLLILVLAAPLFDRAVYRHPAVWIPALGAAGLLLVFVVLGLYAKGVLRLLNRMLDRLTGAPSNRPRSGLARALAWIRGQSEAIGAKLAQTIQILKGNPRAAMAVVGLTILFYSLTWVNVYFGYRTFGITPDFRDIVALLATAMLVSSIPITLGSLGLAEGAYVFYFNLTGIHPAATLAMGLFLRFKLIVVGLVGFIAYLAHPLERNENERIEQDLATGSPTGDS